MRQAGDHGIFLMRHQYKLPPCFLVFLPKPDHSISTNGELGEEQEGRSPLLLPPFSKKCSESSPMVDKNMMKCPRGGPSSAFSTRWVPRQIYMVPFVIFCASLPLMSAASSQQKGGKFNMNKLRYE